MMKAKMTNMAARVWKTLLVALYSGRLSPSQAPSDVCVSHWLSGDVYNKCLSLLGDGPAGLLVLCVYVGLQVDSRGWIKIFHMKGVCWK